MHACFRLDSDKIGKKKNKQNVLEQANREKGKFRQKDLEIFMKRLCPQ